LSFFCALAQRLVSSNIARAKVDDFENDITINQSLIGLA
jgi:hypothetical protein